ncbi:hypothetical protein LSH36_337g01059 [Paralvinella palmiformis]|uniref:Uncharacterized protein n=1 Tax=Paralvinella palmiformis TaxID=53620 RepID=A0AAD9N040_9ANNE|nr:hypothetical protein LSH36_337g01059 [Paralvinella palmiformis]
MLHQQQDSSLQQELSQAMLNGELSFALSQQENDASSATDQPTDGIDGGQDRVARQQSMTGSRKGRSGGAQLEKQGSIMSNYFSPVPDREELDVLESDEDIECDEPATPTNMSLSQTAPYYGYVDGMTNGDHLINSSPLASSDPGYAQDNLDSVSPERLFKVVFVGDSGVGKSSFIHQFCNQTFKATFSATIGVDFQVKNVRVDGHVIALQLWDTAGQERFRSITKQYFRKADGVLVMYDVTSEVSFKNVRNWMISVQLTERKGRSTNGEGAQLNRRRPDQKEMLWLIWRVI